MSIATKTAGTSHLSNTEPSQQLLGELAFTHLLDQHPRRLTIDQLGREINSSDPPALERAIASLDEACLLNCQHGELIPSPAAIRVDGTA